MREILGDFMKDFLTMEKEERVSLAYTSSVDLSQQPQASAASWLSYHQEASLPLKMLSLPIQSPLNHTMKSGCPDSQQCCVAEGALGGSPRAS